VCWKSVPARERSRGTLAGRCRTLTVVDVDKRAVAAMNTLFPDGASRSSSEIFSRPTSRRLPVPPGRFRVVGNIPYYITTPILFHVLDKPAPGV